MLAVILIPLNCTQPLKKTTNIHSKTHKMSQPQRRDKELLEREFKRMGFDIDSKWRISDINKDFQLCNSYPRFLIVPSSFSDEDLESVAKFRYFRRIPTAVWRHSKNGCFIVRSSQPTVGWFGWFRDELDENLVQSYVNNNTPQTCQTKSDPPTQTSNQLNTETINQQRDGNNPIATLEKTVQSDHDPKSKKEETLEQRVVSFIKNPSESPNNINIKSATDNDNSKLTTSDDMNDVDIKQFSSSINGDSINLATAPAQDSNSETNDNSCDSSTASKMLIIDARSYTAAMANRAKGGGCECSEYYQRCEVHFMNLANIHSIRKSYHAIRSVCEAYSEQSNK